MEKYIEEIIEIVLDNVSCDHPQRDEYSPGGIGMAHVEYSLINEKKVMKKAIAALPARLIEKPLLTEKFIEKKTRELHDKLWGKIACPNYDCSNMEIFGEFICSLLNELAAKINLKGD